MFNVTKLKAILNHIFFHFLSFSTILQGQQYT